MKLDDKTRAACAVGPLLYTPASSVTVAEHTLNGDWPGLTALALCLEDAVLDAGLPAAERQLVQTLARFHGARGASLPMLFVRVRTPEHLRRVHRMLGPSQSALTGYILPKCDLDNVDGFFEALDEADRDRERPLFAMPILESAMFARAATRRDALMRMRDKLDAHSERVLNVRVGGNDFCRLYGLRRSVTQTIYDLGPVRDILVDILNVFLEDYVVSGPVWEYYGADPSAPWARGLRRELELDRANGFLGKTAIHPSQLPLICESMRVTPADAADARRLLNWSEGALGVAGGEGRMNEVRCHDRWAEGIALRSELYGTSE